VLARRAAQLEAKVSHLEAQEARAAEAERAIAGERERTYAELLAAKSVEAMRNEAHAREVKGLQVRGGWGTGNTGHTGEGALEAGAVAGNCHTHASIGTAGSATELFDKLALLSSLAPTPAPLNLYPLTLARIASRGCTQSCCVRKRRHRARKSGAWTASRVCCATAAQHAQRQTCCADSWRRHAPRVRPLRTRPKRSASSLQLQRLSCGCCSSRRHSGLRWVWAFGLRRLILCLLEPAHVSPVSFPGFTLQRTIARGSTSGHLSALHPSSGTGICRCARGAAAGGLCARG
jgi:hypothetical protein